MSDIRKQDQQSLDPKKYKNRILIASTVKDTEKGNFFTDIDCLVNNYDDDILFISCGRTDHEQWIIEWCINNQYPCKVIDFNMDEPMKSISDACLLSSEIIIFTCKSEYPYNMYSSAAKKNKLHISTIIVK